MLRILHYLPSLNERHGGPVRAVKDLTRALVEQGHSVTLATTDPGDGLSGMTVIRIAPTYVGAGLLGSDARHAIRTLLDNSDVLHVHGPWELSNAQATWAARAAGKPYILSPRGMLDDWSMAQKALKKRLYHTLIARNVLERAAAVHCTAEGELLQSGKWFPKGNGVVIPNFLDLNPYRHAPGPEEAHTKFPAIVAPRPRVLFLSRLHYKKGADVFIEAAALATRDGIDATWVVAGSGEADYDRQMRQLAVDRGISDRVVFTGHVGGSLKVSLYQACEVFALPTSQENFGFVFPESLACSTPVVTTKGVDIWPELEQSGGSLIVDRTPQAFAEAVGGLLLDDRRRRAMGEAGRRWVFERFDESRLIAEFDGLYKACVK